MTMTLVATVFMNRTYSLKFRIESALQEVSERGCLGTVVLKQGQTSRINTEPLRDQIDQEQPRRSKQPYNIDQTTCVLRLLVQTTFDGL